MIWASTKMKTQIRKRYRRMTDSEEIEIEVGWGFSLRYSRQGDRGGLIIATRKE